MSSRRPSNQTHQAHSACGEELMGLLTRALPLMLPPVLPPAAATAAAIDVVLVDQGTLSRTHLAAAVLAMVAALG